MELHGLNEMLKGTAVLVKHNQELREVNQALRREVARLQKKAAGLEKEKEGLEDAIQDLEDDKQGLEEDIQGLEEDNQELENDNQELRSHNEKLQEDTNTLKWDVRQLQEQVRRMRHSCEASDCNLKYIFPFLKRVLLDKARGRILDVWAPLAGNPKAKWTDMRTAMSKKDLHEFIHDHRIFSRPLLDAAITIIYEVYTPVRVGGNIIAHEADIEIFRQAVREDEDTPDTRALKNIFECIFDDDLDGDNGTQ